MEEEDPINATRFKEVNEPASPHISKVIGIGFPRRSMKIKIETGNNIDGIVDGGTGRGGTGPVAEE